MPPQKRTFRSYHPAYNKDNSGARDRKRTVQVQLSTLSATSTRDIFKAQSEVYIKTISIVVDLVIAASNTNYWAFDVLNFTKGSASIFTQLGLTAPDTRAASLNGLVANQDADLYVDAGGVNPSPSTGYFLAPNDVLQLVATKNSAPSNLQDILVIIDFEISGVTTTTSTSTTSTTSTTTSISTSSSTTSTTTISTSTTIT